MDEPRENPEASSPKIDFPEVGLSFSARAYTTFLSLRLAVNRQVSEVESKYPQLRCVKDCGKCCTENFVVASSIEAALIKRSLLASEKQEVWERALLEARRLAENRDSGSTEPFVCPFYHKPTKTCTVHADRPLMCRLYLYEASLDEDGTMRHRICKVVKELLGGRDFAVPYAVARDIAYYIAPARAIYQAILGVEEKEPWATDTRDLTDGEIRFLWEEIEREIKEKSSKEEPNGSCD
jgi:Fe-S-cluster containining protein